MPLIHLSNCQYTTAPIEHRGYLTYCGKRLAKETDDDEVMLFHGIYFLLNKERYNNFKKQNPNHTLCKSCLETTASSILNFIEDK